MVVHILISIASYFVLMYLSVNLLGLFVRGLFSSPELNKLGLEGNDFIKTEIKKHQRADIWINIIALILIAVYLYLLSHFWNMGVMAVAIIFIVTRLPDLIWEIKHGKKIDAKSAPKNILSYVNTILDWGMLPVLYYFLYYF